MLAPTAQSRLPNVVVVLYSEACTGEESFSTHQRVEPVRQLHVVEDLPSQIPDHKVPLRSQTFYQPS